MTFTWRRISKLDFFFPASFLYPGTERTSLCCQCLLWWGEANEPSKWVTAAVTLWRDETDIAKELRVASEGSAFCGARFKAVGSKQLNHYDWSVSQTESCILHPVPLSSLRLLKWKSSIFYRFRVCIHLFSGFAIKSASDCVCERIHTIVSADIRRHGCDAPVCLCYDGEQKDLLNLTTDFFFAHK